MWITIANASYAFNIYVRSNKFFILIAEKIRICKGYLYSNASHLMPFVSDIYGYVPIWISNISGDSS